MLPDLVFGSCVGTPHSSFAHFLLLSEVVGCPIISTCMRDQYDILRFLSTSTLMIMTDSELGVHLLEGRTCMYPQYRHFAIHMTVFGYLFWSQVDIS